MNSCLIMKRKYGRSNINRSIVTPKCQLGDGRRRDDFVNRIVIKPKGGEARSRGGAQVQGYGRNLYNSCSTLLEEMATITPMKNKKIATLNLFLS